MHFVLSHLLLLTDVQSVTVNIVIHELWIVLLYYAMAVSTHFLLLLAPHINNRLCKKKNTKKNKVYILCSGESIQRS